MCSTTRPHPFPFLDIYPGVNGPSSPFAIDKRELHAHPPIARLIPPSSIPPRCLRQCWLPHHQRRNQCPQAHVAHHSYTPVQSPTCTAFDLPISSPSQTGPASPPTTRRLPPSSLPRPRTPPALSLATSPSSVCTTMNPQIRTNWASRGATSSPYSRPRTQAGGPRPTATG